jgi:hypothetical protein
MTALPVLLQPQGKARKCWRRLDPNHNNTYRRLPAGKPRLDRERLCGPENQLDFVAIQPTIKILSLARRGILARNWLVAVEKSS